MISITFLMGMMMLGKRIGFLRRTRFSARRKESVATNTISLPSSYTYTLEISGFMSDIAALYATSFSAPTILSTSKETSLPETMGIVGKSSSGYDFTRRLLDGVEMWRFE